jgi:hypothetical protein
MNDSEQQTGEKPVSDDATAIDNDPNDPLEHFYSETNLEGFRNGRGV